MIEISSQQKNIVKSHTHAHTEKNIQKLNNWSNNFQTF